MRWTKVLLDFPKQPSPREGPGALNGAKRHTQLFGRLLVRQSNEKAKFHHFGGAGIKLRQPPQRFVQSQQVIIGQLLRNVRLLEFHPLPLPTALEAVKLIGIRFIKAHAG